jgi:HKD family nuclease
MKFRARLTTLNPKFFGYRIIQLLVSDIFIKRNTKGSCSFADNFNKLNTTYVLIIKPEFNFSIAFSALSGVSIILVRLNRLIMVKTQSPLLIYAKNLARHDKVIT